MNDKKLKDTELDNVNGGFIPPLPPVSKIESSFNGTFDGNGKTVDLNIRPDESYSADAVPPAADIISELKS